jgi:hypothetical protein
MIMIGVKGFVKFQIPFLFCIQKWDEFGDNIMGGVS